MDVAGVAEAVNGIDLDRDFIAQDQLDIETRAATSLYPWKGQFSPGLISTLLDAYASPDDIVLDPFAGSGTTLYESARKGYSCYGVEINPAALELAGMVKFVSLAPEQRQQIADKADGLMEQCFSRFASASLFSQFLSDDQDNVTDIEADIKKMLEHAQKEPLLHRLLATSVMIGMGNSATVESDKILASHRSNVQRIMSLPAVEGDFEVFPHDARDIPLKANTVNLVITSPPYINVFNYHQNYRKAMELMGWRPLQVATSEIGSNRKHRGNRFLTVIQYCLDLAQTLYELRRVVKAEGAVIFVIGRESTVRGVSFRNGALLAQVAVAASGFAVDRWQERRFTNRYGQSIFEDIITLSVKLDAGELNLDAARGVGLNALETSESQASAPEVLADLWNALEYGNAINPSPCLATAATLPVGDLEAPSTGPSI